MINWIILLDNWIFLFEDNLQRPKLKFEPALVC